MDLSGKPNTLYSEELCIERQKTEDVTVYDDTATRFYKPFYYNYGYDKARLRKSQKYQQVFMLVCLLKELR